MFENAAEGLDIIQSYEAPEQPYKTLEYAGCEVSGRSVVELHTTHKEITRLAIKGMTAGEIAAEMGMNKKRVEGVLGSKLVKAQIDELGMQADVDTVNVGQELREAAADAVKFFRQVLNDRIEGISPKLKSEIAMDVLDRSGHGKVQKIEGRYAHGLMHQVPLLDIKRRAREVAIELGAVAEEPINV